MKKVYMTPVTMMTEISTEMPIATSIAINDDQEKQITNAEEILARERIIQEEGEEAFEEQNVWENGLW